MKDHYYYTRRNRRTPGFTLFELIASMAAASVLMVGLSSALFIAVQGVDVSDSRQSKVLETHALLADMQADLQFATAITEQAVDAITVTIPDRDDPDTTPDTVRYRWNGAATPLTRQYNGGAEVVVAESVFSLRILYRTEGTSIGYITVAIELVNAPNVFVICAIPMVNQP